MQLQYIHVEGVNMSGIGWKENIRIDVRDIDGRLIDTTEFNNQIEDTGLDYLARSLASSTFDMKIRYMGWGSSDLALSTAHTALAEERGRKIITVSATSTTIGIIYNTVYLSPSEATTDIEDWRGLHLPLRLRLLIPER